MVSWQARIDSITGEHVAAVRRAESQITEIDDEARSAVGRIGERARATLVYLWSGVPESMREKTERDARAERERLLREPAERRAGVAERPVVGKRGREEYVLPSDWTDEDEARAQGYGPPDSWLA